jgi:hypothetical protein
VVSNAQVTQRECCAVPAQRARITPPSLRREKHDSHAGQQARNCVPSCVKSERSDASHWRNRNTVVRAKGLCAATRTAPPDAQTRAFSQNAPLDSCGSRRDLERTRLALLLREEVSQCRCVVGRLTSGVLAGCTHHALIARLESYTLQASSRRCVPCDSRLALPKIEHSLDKTGWPAVTRHRRRPSLQAQPVVVPSRRLSEKNQPESCRAGDPQARGAASVLSVATTSARGRAA